MGVRAPGDVTAAWLQDALGCGPIASFTTERIGTGQMSESHRVSITYASDAAPGPPSVVLKVAAADETSRQTGLALGLYERETRFYAEVAPLIGGPLAACHHTSFDPADGTFALLLGDAGPAVQGDEIAGCDLDAARLALAELGRLHGPALGNPTLAGSEWLNRDSPVTQALVTQLLDGFLARYADRVAPEHRLVAERLAASFDAWSALDHGLEGLVHGDYRLDNLLFGRDGAERPLTVVDWQTVAWGPAMIDVAYFLGGALAVEDRRAHADELLAVYRDALGPDAPPLTLDEIRAGVRGQSFFGVLMAVISPMLVQQTPRGDDMFMTMFARHCQHVLDLDALAVLPAATDLQPLRPTPEDEGPHEPGPEPLWNESWYFDVADPAAGIGAWFRIGLDPAAGTCWHTTVVCGPGRPTVALVDFAAPLPEREESTLTVRTDVLESRQECLVPLERYRVSVRGRAASYDDPAALLRGEAGEPVDLALDLVWETAGTPFQYRLAPRYEIACTVSGTLTIGEETFALEGAAGQRDHSWAPRDWWSMDWVWSAGHLDDGTHLHGLCLRIPGMSRLGAGYVQPPDGAPLAELTRAPADEALAPDGLGARTVQRFGDLDVVFEPLGHGPLRLVAGDGRVALFPRAWGRLSTGDGRTGVGWMEWNVTLGA